MPMKDLFGRRFGRYLVVEIDRRPNGLIFWKCRCDCGVEKSVYGAALRSGQTQSCGCYQKDIMRQRATHGMARLKSISPEWEAWSKIRDRCDNPNNPNYDRYGGRGIRVCDRWQDSFENFYADMGERPSGKTSIDRIDNDGPYCKENCRWSDPKEQARNRRSNRVVKYRGREMTLKEASELAGLPYKSVWQRVVKLGWPLDRALSEAVVLGNNQYG